MSFASFPMRYPILSTNLPLTMMTLDDWILVNVTGQDSEKYLQSQLTIDVKQINKHQHLLAAHCNPKGKMWSSIRLFRRGEGFSFIERRSVLNIQLSELKKYAIFSNVTFNYDNDIVLLGIAGFKSRDTLKNLFTELPNTLKPMIINRETYILWFKYPIERFLLITNEKIAHSLTKELQGVVEFNNSQQWLALDIEAGIPIIDYTNISQFVPQATNLQALGGINFRKGCYIGQEIVARAEFRGLNKLALYYLAGTSNRIPKIGEKLEMKIGDNWHRTGTVLAAVRLIDNHLILQAVLNYSIDHTNMFRVILDHNTLNIKALPYPIRKK